MIDPYAELARLTTELDKRSVAVQAAEDWYDGRHPIPAPPANTAAAAGVGDAANAFRTMSELAITNLLPPVVNEPAKKLRVEGFQFSESPTTTDSEAWRIWQRNGLDADAPLAFKAAVKTGQAFAVVWQSGGLATIDVEDPSQCIVSYVAGSRRQRRSGLKRWLDEDGYTCATLYLPNEIYKFRSKDQRVYGPMLPMSGGWVPREVPGEAWPIVHQLGVNLVELRVGATLKPSLFGGGRPQFTSVINEQRKINAIVMNLLITLENQAFRQRWATGWDYPQLEDGTPDLKSMARASASRLWALEGDDVKVGEFAQADFRPFLDVLSHFTKVMSFKTSTPPHAFLLGEMVNVAADSLARLDGSHIDEVQSIADGLGEGMEEVMRLALLAESNPKAADTGSSVRWAEFEHRTATEQMGVATALKELGAPTDVVFAATPGTTQQEAARWARQQGGSAILEAVLSNTSDAGRAP